MSTADRPAQFRAAKFDYDMACWEEDTAGALYADALLATFSAEPDPEISERAAAADRRLSAAVEHRAALSGIPRSAEHAGYLTRRAQVAHWYAEQFASQAEHADTRAALDMLRHEPGTARYAFEAARDIAALAQIDAVAADHASTRGDEVIPARISPLEWSQAAAIERQAAEVIARTERPDPADVEAVQAAVQVDYAGLGVDPTSAASHARLGLISQHDLTPEQADEFFDDAHMESLAHRAEPALWRDIPDVTHPRARDLDALERAKQAVAQCRAVLHTRATHPDAHDPQHHQHIAADHTADPGHGLGRS